MSLSCRYCPLYCPSPSTPVWGHCVAQFPPKWTYGLTRACPFKGDETLIQNYARAHGFLDNDLRGLLYFGETGEGLRTPVFYDLDKLRRYAGGSGADYTFYVCYLDPDKRIFGRAVVP